MHTYTHIFISYSTVGTIFTQRVNEIHTSELNAK